MSATDPGKLLEGIFARGAELQRQISLAEMRHARSVMAPDKIVRAVPFATPVPRLSRPE